MTNRRAIGTSRRGLTVLELLVVAGIFALVLLFTTVLYMRGRDAVAQSTDKVDTSGRARRTLDAIAPIVSSAVEIGGFEGLEVYDPTAADPTDACHLDVTTRENFLDPHYSPTQSFDPQSPYYRFRIAFDPNADELRLYQLKLVPTEVDPTVPSRLLARNVLECRMEPVTVGSVSLTLKIRADRADSRRPDGFTTTVIESILAAPGTKI